MRKILPLLIFALIFFLPNISFAQETNYSYEIGGAFIYSSGSTLLFPYGEISASFSLFNFLKLESSLDVILLFIIPIFSPSGRIILEIPSYNRIQYLGVGLRNFIIWGEELYLSPFVAEFFVGIKFATRGRSYFLSELLYLTSSQIFYGEFPTERLFVIRFGLEF